LADDHQSLLSHALSMVRHNKRYLFWFWVLNLTLAEFGTAAFRKSAHALMDHSLYSINLLQRFDISVFGELLSNPRFGPVASASTPAMYFAFLYFAATALFLPGVFSGYASNYRLPRDEFFRSCGRNLWRFVRLILISALVLGTVAGVLFSLNEGIVKKAAESTNELLPIELRMVGLTLIFLVMTTVRIWFDLAEVDIVLADQRAVRKAISAGFRHTFRRLASLLASYVLTSILSIIVLIAGLFVWMKLVSPQSVVGAFVVAQVISYLMLIPRFWQRAVAVTYWQRNVLIPVAAIPPIAPTPVPVAPPAFADSPANPAVSNS